MHASHEIGSDGKGEGRRSRKDEEHPQATTLTDALTERSGSQRRSENEDTRKETVRQEANKRIYALKLERAGNLKPLDKDKI